ncbi:hypothetical protein B0H13DRAFT_1861669 [Mycena leptocephala]|nr:hypothetical protein B0H13DRAFT_1861669 [Mycena leptocephala]
MTTTSTSSGIPFPSLIYQLIQQHPHILVQGPDREWSRSHDVEDEGVGTGSNLEPAEDHESVVNEFYALVATKYSQSLAHSEAGQNLSALATNRIRISVANTSSFTPARDDMQSPGTMGDLESQQLGDGRPQRCATFGVEESSQHSCQKTKQMTLAARALATILSKQGTSDVDIADYFQCSEATVEHALRNKSRDDICNDSGCAKQQIAILCSHQASRPRASPFAAHAAVADALFSFLQDYEGLSPDFIAHSSLTVTPKARRSPWPRNPSQRTRVAREAMHRTEVSTTDFSTTSPAKRKATSTTATHPRSRRPSASLKREKMARTSSDGDAGFPAARKEQRKPSRSLSQTVNHDSETVSIDECDSDEDECVSDVDEWDSSDECDSDKYDSDEYNSHEYNSDNECGSKPDEWEGNSDDSEVDIDDCDLQPPPNNQNGLSSAHPGLPMNGPSRRTASKATAFTPSPICRCMWLNYIPIVPTIKLFFGAGIDNLLQCDQDSTVDAVCALERSADTIGATSNNQMHSYSVGGTANKLRRKHLNVPNNSARMPAKDLRKFLPDTWSNPTRSQTCRAPARQNNEVLLTNGVIKSISELTGRLDCVEKTLQLDPYPFFGPPDVAEVASMVIGVIMKSISELARRLDLVEYALDQRQGQAYYPGEFNGPPSGSSASDSQPENSPPAHRAGDASCRLIHLPLLYGCCCSDTKYICRECSSTYCGTETWLNLVSHWSDRHREKLSKILKRSAGQVVEDVQRISCSERTNAKREQQTGKEHKKTKERKTSGTKLQPPLFRLGALSSISSVNIGSLSSDKPTIAVERVNSAMNIHFLALIKVKQDPNLGLQAWELPNMDAPICQPYLYFVSVDPEKPQTTQGSYKYRPPGPIWK